MENIKQTTKLVQAILETDKRCRNSDGFLYLKVLSVVAKRKGVSLDALTLPKFFEELHGTVFPPFESVRRSRQKLQERIPELAACEAVQEYRAENEMAVREFVKGDI